MLRQQLATERHRLYRLSTDQTDEQRRELERTRKQLQAKTEELDLLFADFDKQRVQILQLTHQAAAATKLNDALRAENQLLAQQLKRVPETPAPLSALPLPLPLPLSRCHVDPYEGQGVEGYPYYETLSKEFRVRFRRACLKEKELLYKANGMEIGVITSFEQPNGLSFLLHLTNYGDAPLEGLRGKVMNPNGNRLSNDSFQYARLEPSEQLKVNCLLHLAYYPIGPLTFLLEFTALAKHEIRILLPAHIFKTVELEDRSSPLADPLALHIPTERKICKDLNDLKAYLKGCKVGKGGMRTAVYHRQTHTVLHMDLEEAKEGLALHYEHVEGNKDISDYFIKTFAFLLAK